jgi:mono/diheme cytochrome c family protein
MSSIEKNINDIATVIGLADGAQSTADTALANAATAQTTATAANTNANTRVLKSAGPAFTNATGTAARTALASYPGQTISAVPTQAEVQQIDDALKALSQHVVAVINDLKNNQALT